VKVSGHTTPATPEGNRLSHAFRAPFHHADPTGRVGIVPLANYLQQAAGEHAERLGLGAERLMQEGLFWVLTRIYLNIERAPRAGQSLTVETWPSRPPRQLFQRDFQIRSEDAGLLITATSSWALIDAATRKAVRGPAWIAGRVAYEAVRAVEFPVHRPTRLNSPELSFDIVPRRSELDLNGHVNNASLMGWLFEVLDDAWLNEHGLAALDIVFRSECTREHAVHSWAVRLGDNHFQHALRRDNGVEIARAKSWWRRGA